MDRLNKINKVLFVTLIVMCISVFGYCSKTVSKYFVADSTDNIVYNLSFRKLKYPETSVVTTVNDNDDPIIFTMRFYRNSTILDDSDSDSIVYDESIKSDQYTITVNEGCTITQVSNTNAVNDLKEDGDNKPNTVSLLFENDVESNTNKKNMIAVTYTCPVDVVKVKDEKKISTSVTIMENINDEGEFIYHFSSEPFDYVDKVIDSEMSDDYLKLYIPDDMTNEEERRTQIRNWIDKFLSTYYPDDDQTKFNFRKDALYSYFRVNKIVASPTSIKGVSYVDSDKEDYSKMYVFDMTTLSYALTDSSGTNNMYFVVTEESEAKFGKFTVSQVNEMFEYYLEKYYSTKFTADERNTIKEYVTKKGGIANVLSGAIVPGVNLSISQEYVYFDSKILNLIYADSISSDIIVLQTDGQTSPAKIASALASEIVAKNKEQGYKWFASSNESSFKNSVVYGYAIRSLFSNMNSSTNAYVFVPAGNELVRIRLYNENVSGEDISFAQVDKLDGSEYISYADATNMVFMYDVGTDVLSEMKADVTNIVNSIMTQVNYLNNAIDSELGTNYSAMVTQETVKNFLENATDSENWDGSSLFHYGYGGFSINYGYLPSTVAAQSDVKLGALENFVNNEKGSSN